MKKLHLLLTTFFCLFLAGAVLAQERPANYARGPRFKALLYYSEGGEDAHVDFARQGIRFFQKLTVGEGFYLDVATDLTRYSYDQLKGYTCIIMLNNSPHSQAERDLFEKYMENGGGWMGFHVAAYNDRNTHWPWLVDFLGCGIFKCNNWPPQQALAEVDMQSHPVMKNLPSSFVLPASEFYQWEEDLRAKENIDVLLSLSEKNYPFGLKDVVYGGDWPVVWTNRNYRMIYLNMGHGDNCFTEATQNLMFVNAFRWIVSRDPSGNPFDK